MLFARHPGLFTHGVIPQRPIVQAQPRLDGPHLLGRTPYRSEVVHLGQPVGQHLGVNLTVYPQLAKHYQGRFAFQVIKMSSSECPGGLFADHFFQQGDHACGALFLLGQRREPAVGGRVKVLVGARRVERLP